MLCCVVYMFENEGDRARRAAGTGGKGVERVEGVEGARCMERRGGDP